MLEVLFSSEKAMEVWDKYSACLIINGQGLQDRLLEKIFYLIPELKVSWGKIFKTFENTSSVWASYLTKTTWRFATNFWELHHFEKFCSDLLALWIFAILKNQHIFNKWK